METSPETAFAQTIRTAIDSMLIDLHTSLPCEVVAVDYAMQTVNVKIVVNRITADDEPLPFDIITEVPIGYTQTKKYSITLPINTGDTGQLIFNERQLDNWIVNNEIKEPDDTRKHSLSDALFIPNFVSRINNIPNISTSELEIRTRDNLTKLRVNENGTITADCINFVVNSTNTTINATAKFKVVSPVSEFSAAVNVLGLLSASAYSGLVGSSMTTNVNLETTKDVIASGISVKNHTHSGVQTGSGNTGVPQ